MTDDGGEREMVVEKPRTSTRAARYRDTADATEALAALGALAAHIAHDLNNLLAAVVGDLAWLTGALAGGSEALTTAERGLGVEALAAALDGGDAPLPTRYVFDEGHHVFDAADNAFAAHLTEIGRAHV